MDSVKQDRPDFATIQPEVDGLFELIERNIQNLEVYESVARLYYAFAPLFKCVPDSDTPDLEGHAETSRVPFENTRLGRGITAITQEYQALLGYKDTIQGAIDSRNTDELQGLLYDLNAHYRRASRLTKETLDEAEGRLDSFFNG